MSNEAIIIHLRNGVTVVGMVPSFQLRVALRTGPREGERDWAPENAVVMLDSREICSMHMLIHRPCTQE